MNRRRPNDRCDARSIRSTGICPSATSNVSTPVSGESAMTAHWTSLTLAPHAIQLSAPEAATGSECWWTDDRIRRPAESGCRRSTNSRVGGFPGTHGHSRALERLPRLSGGACSRRTLASDSVSARSRGDSNRVLAGSCGLCIRAVSSDRATNRHGRCLPDRKLGAHREVQLRLQRIIW